MAGQINGAVGQKVMIDGGGVGMVMHALTLSRGWAKSPDLKLSCDRTFRPVEPASTLVNSLFWVGNIIVTQDPTGTVCAFSTVHWLHQKLDCYQFAPPGQAHLRI